MEYIRRRGETVYNRERAQKKMRRAEIKGGNHPEGVHVSFPNPLRWKSLVYVDSELLSKPCAAFVCFFTVAAYRSHFTSQKPVSKRRAYSFTPLLAAGGFSVLSSILFALLFVQGVK